MRHMIHFIVMFFLLMPHLSYAYKIGDVETKLTGSINETYDDNVSYLSTDAKEDFITDTSLGLNMDYIGKNRNFTLSGNLTQHNFAKNNEFNNTAEDLSLDFKQEFSKYDRISINNKFLHAEEPYSFEDEFGIVTDKRYSYYKNAFIIQYLKDITKQLGLTLGYKNEAYDYSRQDSSDSYLHKFSVETDYYSLNSKTIFLGLFEYIQRQFEHSDSAETIRATGGIRQYLTKQLYLDIRGGKDFITSFDNQDSTGQFISASLINDVDENTNLQLSYSKEDTTTAYSQDIFDSQRISFSAVRQLLERLKASTSAFYGEGSYSSSNIEDRLKGVNTQITYELSPKAKLKVSYSYSRTDSNISTREYTKNVALAGLSYEF